MMMMKSAMKASMKMKKSMKAMVMKKAMKKRAMKKTAKSYKTTSGARAAVFSGKIMKSKGGLIVSKKASANGKKAYKRIAKWNAAVQKARKALNIKGFQAVGGKSAKGQALLKKARS